MQWIPYETSVGNRDKDTLLLYDRDSEFTDTILFTRSFFWLSLLVHLMLALYTLHLLFTLHSSLPKHLSPQGYTFLRLPTVPFLQHITPATSRSFSLAGKEQEPTAFSVFTMQSSPAYDHPKIQLTKTFEEEALFHGKEMTIHCNENLLLKFTQIQGKIPYSESKTGQFQLNRAGSGAALKKIQTEIHYQNKVEQ